MTAASTPDPASADQMLKAIRALVPPGAVVEMRIPEYGWRKTNTASGYLDDLETFVTATRAHDGKAAGIYFTMNPVKPELLARKVNRSEQYAKLTTADHDIERRRWVRLAAVRDGPRSNPLWVPLNRGVDGPDGPHKKAISIALRARTRLLPAATGCSMSAPENCWI